MTDDVSGLRPRLMSVAYRMLGSVADAEDAVQDAFLRYHTAGGVSSPEGFLVGTPIRTAPALDAGRCSKSLDNRGRGVPCAGITTRTRDPDHP